MSDNPKKKRADGKRVALSQDHEREYLLAEVNEALLCLNVAINHAQMAEGKLMRAYNRLRAGFPTATKGKRRGAK